MAEATPHLRSRAHRALRLAGLTAAFIVALWLVIRIFPEVLTGKSAPGKHGDDVARTRTAILTFLAGGLAAVGAYYTHHTFGLNRQGQITERFTRAVDQLGDEESVHVRLGGIYALERLARESKADQGPILEILTAYVRNKAPRAANGSNEDPPADPAVDIQATLTVIARRTLEHDPDPPWRLELAGVDLSCLHLPDGHLERAGLAGTRLDDADLADAHLEECRLTDAHLARANLFRAHLERANLTGARLGEAKLTNAHLQAADLVGADLTGAHLERADLTAASLQGADLSGASLQAADLSGANLEDAMLAGTELEGVVYSATTVWPQGFDRASWGMP